MSNPHPSIQQTTPHKLIEKMVIFDDYCPTDKVIASKQSFASLLQAVGEEIIGETEKTNNFRQAKVDGKEDWNDALEQSACKVDALIKKQRSRLKEIIKSCSDTKG